MRNAKVCEKRFKFLKLTPAIRVKGNYFGFEVIFHKIFEGWKNFEDIRFVFHRIKPGVFSKMIHKNYKIFVLINRFNRGRTPYINVNDFKRAMTFKR